VNEAPNFDAVPTIELFEKEMERLLGTLRPGRAVSDFKTWAQEIKTRHGHEPYGRLRRAVNLVLSQTDEIPPPSLFAMFMREAARQLAEERATDAPRLTVDEERQKAEHNTTYAEIYKRVGIGTEPFEWNLCRGIAKQRFRIALPTDEQIEEVYQKRRAMDIPVGKWGLPKHFPTWNKTQEDKDDYWTPELPPSSQG